MRYVSWDTETWLIREIKKDPSSSKKNNRLCEIMSAPKLVCGSFYCDKWSDKSPRLMDAKDTLDELHYMLTDESCTIIGHNIAYDFGVAAAENPALIPLIFAVIKEGRVSDTFIRQKLIDIANGERSVGQGLGSLSYRLLGETLDKGEDTWRLRYSELDGIPIDQWEQAAIDYSKKDALVTWRVWEAQEKLYGVEGKGWLRDENLQVRAAWALKLMSLWGVRTDPESVKQLKEVLDAEHEQTRETLKDSGIFRLDGTRNMKLIKDKVIAGYSGFPPLTETGQPQTSEQTLLESNDPDLLVLAQSLSHEKIRSSWIPALEVGTKYPICCNYNVLVDSGRTSAQAPNLQNPPRENGVRQCFVPRPGFVFCAVDYDTAELRSLAEVTYSLFGYSAMRDALIEGQDLHLTMAANIKGCTYPEMLTLYKQGDKEAKELRQMSKAVGFGVPGGLGIAKLIDFAKNTYGVIITEPEAKQLKEQYFQTYPEVRQYLQEYIDAAINDTTDKPIGSLWQYGNDRLRGDLTYCSGANTLFQGGVADGAKEALWALAEACYVPGKDPVMYGSRPVLFLHDEIIAELPDDIAHEAAHRMAEIMREAMSLRIKNVPITCSPALMRRWQKGCNPNYQNGRLIPSEDK